VLIAKTSFTLQLRFWGQGDRRVPLPGCASILPRRQQRSRASPLFVDLADVHMPIADQQLRADAFDPHPLAGQRAAHKPPSFPVFPYALADPAPPAVGDREAGEAGKGALCRVAQSRRGHALGCPNGGERSWRVATGLQSGPPLRAAPCLLRRARDSEIDARPIAQPADRRIRTLTYGGGRGKAGGGSSRSILSSTSQGW